MAVAVAVAESPIVVVEFACEEVEVEEDQGVGVDVEEDADEEEPEGEEETPQALRLASEARAATCKTTALTPPLHLSFSFLACSASFSVRAASFASFSVRGWGAVLTAPDGAEAEDDEDDEDEDEEDPSDSCGKKHLPTFCGPNSQISVFKPLSSSSLTVTSLLTLVDAPKAALVDAPNAALLVDGYGTGGLGGGDT